MRLGALIALCCALVLLLQAGAAPAKPCPKKPAKSHHCPKPKPPVEAAPPGDPYAPSLPKPPFADDHSQTDPLAGEWGPKTDPYWIRSTGSLHALLVPVDFADYPSVKPVSFYDNLFGITARAWFKTASFGRLTLDLQTVDRWTRMAKPAAAYGLQHCCEHATVQAFFKELVSTLDPSVDFSKIDSIYVIAPETTGVEINILLWRSWPGEGIVADGKELLWGVVGNGNFAANKAGLLVYFAMTHEAGHFMGLADLYGRDCGTCQDTHDWVGAWTMMDEARLGVDYLAWDKWLLGWLDPAQIRGLTKSGDSFQGKLTADEVAGGMHMIVVPTGPYTATVVEVRKKLGNDFNLCAEGVLVYTIDANVPNGHGPVHVQPAHPTDALRVSQCGALWQAAFGPGERYDDATVTVQVLATATNGFTVRVTRK